MLVVVDVQEEYDTCYNLEYFESVLKRIVQAAKDEEKIVVMWNNHNNDVSERDMQEYFISKLEMLDWQELFGVENFDELDMALSELFGTIYWQEKYYGFIRSAMDEEISDDAIIDLLNILIVEQTYFEDLEREYIMEFLERGDRKNCLQEYYELVEYLDRTGEHFNYSEEVLEVDEISATDTIELIGGQRDYCLHEVWLQLMAMKRKVSVNEALTY